MSFLSFTKINIYKKQKKQKQKSDFLIAVDTSYMTILPQDKVHNLRIESKVLGEDEIQGMVLLGEAGS